MCGVNGIFSFHSASNLPEEAELLATRDAMRARGPDGAGVWWSSNRRCGLGHRRLSIIDLSDRASQPMSSADGHFVVVFNGEIYNYPQLRLKLEAEGVIFRTTSDTEVLLHLYTRYKHEMVHRLRGMYAFAVWDTERQGLFLARDPYGIKPLYTANDGWTFRFASQVKALLAGGRVSRDPEPAGIVGFHLFGNVPDPFTFYREIRALPAGHSQWIDSSGPREPKAFASVAAVLADGVANPTPREELPERIRAGLLDSVKAHLLADVEVGVFLSAGVDSGALLGLMRDAGQRKIRAITLAFEEFRGTSEDELPLAARTCQHYGAEHIVRKLSKREFLEDLPVILDAMDQPSVDGVNAWFVSKYAKEVGLKVAISGLGGDELLGGYPSFQSLPRWRHYVGPLAAIPGLGFVARKIIENVAPSFSRKRPKALGILEFSDSWAGAYLLRRGLFLPHELPNLIGREMAREGLRRLRPLALLTKSLKPDPNSDVGRVCALESTQYMRNQLLRDSDWAGMAHSLEIRMPMVDFTLLQQLSPVLPTITAGVGKAALSQAPAIPLLNEIVTRAKTGFGVPTGAWMNEAASIPSGPMEPANKGLNSRRWSSTVFKSARASDQLETQPS